MLKEIDSKYNCNDIVRLSLFKFVDANISEDEKMSIHAIGPLMQGRVMLKLQLLIWIQIKHQVPQKMTRI